MVFVAEDDQNGHNGRLFLILVFSFVFFVFFCSMHTALSGCAELLFPCKNAGHGRADHAALHL